MIGEGLAIVQARREAARARSRLVEDVALLRERTRPARLASDAVHDVRDRALGAAESGARLAREQPLIAGAGVAAVVVLLSRRSLRKAASATASTLWRNRSLIGRLLSRK